MYLIQVYGAGCAKCAKTFEVIEKECKKLGVEATVEKVTDINMITAAGILRTPGVMVNGELKSTGNIPKADVIKSWFEE
jgi:small redox-active disulfide protein 2